MPLSFLGDEDLDMRYSASAQEEMPQPSSPVIHPSQGTRPRAAVPGLFADWSATEKADGLPWWVWALALWALSKRR